MSPSAGDEQDQRGAEGSHARPVTHAAAYWHATGATDSSDVVRLLHSLRCYCRALTYIEMICDSQS